MMLTGLIMAAVLLATLAVVGGGVIRGGDRQARLAGGGVMAAALLVAVGLYAGYGEFGRPDAPLSDRQAEIADAEAARSISQAETVSALDAARIEARDRPDDIEAQFGLAEAAARAGDSETEIATLKAILEKTGNSAVKAMIGEAISREAGGIITAAALDWIDDALADDPDDWRARYIKGLYFSQTGDDNAALEIWQPLAEDTAGTPIYPAVADAVSLAAERLGLDAANLLPEDTPGPADIAAMISGLETRLLDEDSITDHDGWVMLIRSTINRGNTDALNARIAAMLERLEGPSADPAMDSALLIAITEQLLPPENLPETIPPEVEMILARARDLTPEEPSVLFFSGLMARSQGDANGILTWWGALRDRLEDDNPLRPLIDQELAKLSP